MSSVRVTQVRSSIGETSAHRGTLRALGLGRIGKVAEHKPTPQLDGMLRRVAHLVRVDGKEA